METKVISMNAVTEVREDGITPVTRLMRVEEKKTTEVKVFEKEQLEAQRVEIAADMAYYATARQKELDFIDEMFAEFNKLSPVVEPEVPIEVKP